MFWQKYLAKFGLCPVALEVELTLKQLSVLAIKLMLKSLLVQGNKNDALVTININDKITPRVTASVTNRDKINARETNKRWH